jgi:hypothetical protein
LGYLLVTHELSVYPDEELAKKAYPTWETGWFPTSTWTRPADAQFAPMDSKDQVHFACISTTGNLGPLLSCRLLQRHKRLISLVLVNIDGKTLTLAQIEEALRRMDERMQRY